MSSRGYFGIGSIPSSRFPWALVGISVSSQYPAHAFRELPWVFERFQDNVTHEMSADFHMILCIKCYLYFYHAIYSHLGAEPLSRERGIAEPAVFCRRAYAAKALDIRFTDQPYLAERKARLPFLPPDEDGVKGQSPFSFRAKPCSFLSITWTLCQN